MKQRGASNRYRLGLGGKSQPEAKTEVRRKCPECHQTLGHTENCTRPGQRLRDRALAKLQAQCDRFNAECPVGTEVLVKTDGLGNIITKTTSPAQVLSGHTPVIWLDGISGCYLLDRVSKVHLRFERRDGKLIPHRPDEPDTRTTHPNPADQPNSTTKES
jgi:hypothetical protein